MKNVIYIHIFLTSLHEFNTVILKYTKLCFCNITYIHLSTFIFFYVKIEWDKVILNAEGILKVHDND